MAQTPHGTKDHHVACGLCRMQGIGPQAGKGDPFPLDQCSSSHSFMAAG